MLKNGLPRSLLSQIAQGNDLVVKQLERTFRTTDTLPSTVEEVNVLAGQALAVAQANAALLAVLLDAADCAPRVHLGTMSTQNHDQVEIGGGAIDSTSIGATGAAAGKFTTLAVSGQITSTVSPGTPPLVVGSATKVDNLYVDRAAQADSATYAGHATSADNLGTPGSYPADATDLPTVIALANFIKSQNTSKGI